MQIFKFIFKWLARIIFLLAIIVAAFWVRTKYISELQLINKPTDKVKSVVPENPKEITYSWKYNNTQYTVKETLYGSLYDFYRSSQKSYKYNGELPANWENDFYSMFLGRVNNDNLISQIAADLKSAAVQKKLNDDQIVEMTLAFVQSIPYDEARAKSILAGTGNTNYPYETLYENRGICSDKSFLLYNLLKEMGYGAALLVYDAQKHMAVGIQCPKEYSSYDSGYCYAETTSENFRIGVIPDIDAKRGQAVGLKEINFYDQSQVSQFDGQKLGEAQIFLPTSGQSYQGIIKSYNLAKEIDGLRKSMATLQTELVAGKKSLEADYQEINNLKAKMDKYKRNEDYEEYNDLVPKYNKLIEKYQKAVKAYNQKVTDYNEKVKRYNSLIKSF